MKKAIKLIAVRFTRIVLKALALIILMILLLLNWFVLSVMDMYYFKIYACILILLGLIYHIWRRVILQKYITSKLKNINLILTKEMYPKFINRELNEIKSLSQDLHISNRVKESSNKEILIYSILLILGILSLFI